MNKSQGDTLYSVRDWDSANNDFTIPTVKSVSQYTEKKVAENNQLIYDFIDNKYTVITGDQQNEGDWVNNDSYLPSTAAVSARLDTIISNYEPTPNTVFNPGKFWIEESTKFLKFWNNNQWEDIKLANLNVSATFAFLDASTINAGNNERVTVLVVADDTPDSTAYRWVEWDGLNETINDATTIFSQVGPSLSASAITKDTVNCYVTLATNDPNKPDVVLLPTQPCSVFTSPFVFTTRDVQILDVAPSSYSKIDSPDDILNLGNQQDVNFALAETIVDVNDSIRSDLSDLNDSLLMTLVN